MNEQLQQAMAAFIKTMISTFNTASEFATDQLPEVIQQLLTWNFTHSLLMFFVGVVMLLSSVVLFDKASKYVENKTNLLHVQKQKASKAYESEEPWTYRFGECEYNASVKYPSEEYKKIMNKKVEPGGVDVMRVSGCCIATLSFFTIFGNLDWLKIMVAPKVWLIEYAANMVGSN